ncbi:MAG: MarR family transcriptional regulator [Legionellales bacterium]|nr:MarR family transcriptional regulator [Legionellales bacterium]
MNFSDTAGFKLAKLTRLKRQLLDAYLSKFGLSRTQWQAMFWLDILDNPVPQQDILKNMELDAGHLARVLDQLEKIGYVVRHRAENNRRAVLVTLTTEGKKLNSLIKIAVKKETEVLFKDFSPGEKTQFIEQLDKITHNITLALEKEIK